MFLDSLLDSKLNERLSDGLKAYVWMYYREFTDAEKVDGDTIGVLAKLLEDVPNDLHLDEIVAEVEEMINGSGGIFSQTTGKHHGVGPTYDDDGELTT